MKNHSVHNKGFTLIELLVVVAIIGILAAVIITSLGSARQKARDARVINAMTQIRNQMEVYHSEHRNYGSTTGWDNSNCTGPTENPNLPNLFITPASQGGVKELVESIRKSFYKDDTNFSQFRCFAKSSSQFGIADNWAVLAYTKRADGFRGYVCIDATLQLYTYTGWPFIDYGFCGAYDASQVIPLY